MLRLCLRWLSHRARIQQQVNSSELLQRFLLTVIRSFCTFIQLYCLHMWVTETGDSLVPGVPGQFAQTLVQIPFFTRKNASSLLKEESRFGLHFMWYPSSEHCIHSQMCNIGSHAIWKWQVRFPYSGSWPDAQISKSSGMEDFDEA